MLDNYAKLITAVKNSPWLILPEMLDTMVEILDMRASGVSLTDEEIKARIAHAAESNGPRPVGSAQATHGIGVMGLYGPIFPKANLMTQLSGATSIEQFRMDFRSLMENDLVKAIVMDVDSPGGLSDLVPELCAEIRAARKIKPIYAVANTLATSAAYWLGSQATKLYVTDSGAVGSVGAYAVHTDISRKQAIEGTKTTLISAGKYKTEGNPYEPLSEEALAHRQDQLNELYDQFVSAVATGRMTSVEDVLANYGQGRVLTAAKAMEAGMVDGIATLEEVADMALQRAQPQNAYSAANATTNSSPRISLDFDNARTEHIPEERAEPGTGSPPQPVYEPLEKDAKEGWRRDTPPIENTTENTRGGKIVNREQLENLATKLSVTFDENTTDEQLTLDIEGAIETLNTPTETSVEQQDVAKASAFAEQFPEEYAHMQKLQATAETNEAKSFAASYSDMGTGYGLSALSVERIEAAHLAISHSEFSHDDLRKLMDAVAVGHVKLEEGGSHRETEITGGKFSDLVKNLQTDPEYAGKSYAEIVKIAAEQHPDAYAAWMSRKEG